MVDRIFPVAGFAAGANAALINERSTPTGALGTDALTDPPEIVQLRPEVRALCMQFPDACWCDLDKRRENAETFVQSVTGIGWGESLGDQPKR
jgi:hypothetical protein